MSKPFEFGQTLLIFGLLIGVCIWVGMIISARGEERLSAACKPVEFSTDFVHEVTTALIGQQPTWTLYMQQYMMSGCYYFFSVVLTPYLDETGTVGEPVGGLRAGS
jgi:hypothetical protein